MLRFLLRSAVCFSRMVQHSFLSFVPLCGIRLLSFWGFIVKFDLAGGRCDERVRLIVCILGERSVTFYVVFPTFGFFFLLSFFVDVAWAGHDLNDRTNE